MVVELAGRVEAVVAAAGTAVAAEVEGHAAVVAAASMLVVLGAEQVSGSDLADCSNTEPRRRQEAALKVEELGELAELAERRYMKAAFVAAAVGIAGQRRGVASAASLGVVLVSSCLVYAAAVVGSLVEDTVGSFALGMDLRLMLAYHMHTGFAVVVDTCRTSTAVVGKIQ